MNTRGKAVLASLGSAPKGSVQVMPPEARTPGQYGFQARNPVWSTLANELTQWANGDLSFLEGRIPMTGIPVKPDKDKRKRDAMADVLDGKK